MVGKWLLIMTAFGFLEWILVIILKQHGYLIQIQQEEQVVGTFGDIINYMSVRDSGLISKINQEIVGID